MTEEEKIEADALAWVKSHKSFIIERFASIKNFESDKLPTTVFMAGSPGAGKTEVSKRLVELKKAVRIDADEIRELCPNYTGDNAQLFQRAASKGVHVLFEHVLASNLNVVVDGTFAHNQAIPNIRHSLEHKRTTEIVFVYQDPLTAWDFTQKREVVEKRKITKERFIEAYFKSQENVLLAKETFGNRVKLQLFIKDFKKGLENMELDILAIDPYIKKKYSKDELSKLLI